MMAKKMYHKIFGHDIKEVVDSKASPGSMRPNTEQNAKDASWPLQEKIRRGDFGDDEINILVISNQPYCKRQEITISRSIKKIIPDRKIFFEGVGTAAKADIAIIHSELAALVTEMFLRKIEQDHEVRKRKPEQLMFSTRYAPEISITPPNNSQL
jgi:hypothetical protein